MISKECDFCPCATCKDIGCAECGMCKGMKRTEFCSDYIHPNSDFNNPTIKAKYDEIYSKYKHEDRKENESFGSFGVQKKRSFLPGEYLKSLRPSLTAGA